MRDLAHQDSQTPEVLTLAECLGSPAGIDYYLRQYWVIEPDPLTAEFIRTPLYQLRQAASGGQLRGDCDDAATLAGSLLVALNWPGRFIAIRKPEDPEFSHVFLRTPLLEYAPPGEPGFQFDIDPIVPAEHLPLTGPFEQITVSLL